MILVVDASVALKWQFEDEEETDAAQALLSDYVNGAVELMAPTLFPYEIVSAVHVAVSRKRLTEADGYKAIEYLTDLDIDLHDFGDLIQNTFHLARKHGISPYDGAYLALAEKERCSLITGDKKFFDAVKGSFPLVRWVGDYAPHD